MAYDRSKSPAIVGGIIGGGASRHFTNDELREKTSRALDRAEAAIDAYGMSVGEQARLNSARKNRWALNKFEKDQGQEMALLQTQAVARVGWDDKNIPDKATAHSKLRIETDRWLAGIVLPKRKAA
jgi:hypothetical protein